MEELLVPVLVFAIEPAGLHHHLILDVLLLSNMCSPFPIVGGTMRHLDPTQDGEHSPGPGARRLV